MDTSDSTYFNRHRRQRDPAPDGTTKAWHPFSVWDCIRAVTEFHKDFGGIPADLRDDSVLGVPMGAYVSELYTDLIEANAENRLPELLTQFQEFIEEGA